MKTATLLILFSLTAPTSTAYANETDSSGDDFNTYCTEQAQLAGIEDAAELSQFVQECIDSYAEPAGEWQ